MCVQFTSHLEETLLNDVCLVVEFPLQLIGCIFILYHILGWSAFVGLGAICLVLPLPGYLSNWLRIYQDASLTKMDARVQTISESMFISGSKG